MQAATVQISGSCMQALDRYHSAVSKLNALSCVRQAHVLAVHEIVHSTRLSTIEAMVMPALKPPGGAIVSNAIMGQALAVARVKERRHHKLVLKWAEDLKAALRLQRGFEVVGVKATKPGLMGCAYLVDAQTRAVHRQSRGHLVGPAALSSGGRAIGPARVVPRAAGSAKCFRTPLLYGRPVMVGQRVGCCVRGRPSSSAPLWLL
jgi:hypothetical protein